jgi:hypothetical protein
MVLSPEVQVMWKTILVVVIVALVLLGAAFTTRLLGLSGAAAVLFDLAKICYLGCIFVFVVAIVRAVVRAFPRRGQRCL